ncbi:hypothetical protein TWF281_000246 [Arthrobotrys megalospora]
MASLEGLSKIPEILFDILSHLSERDVYSVLRTCKSLYPACYRHFWSILLFHNYGGVWYPQHKDKLYPRPLRRRCDGLADRIYHGDITNMGFEFTRVIWFGNHIFGDNNSSMRKELKGFVSHLRGLIVSGSLNLRHAIISYHADHDGSQDYGILRDLKKYSEARTIREFSINLQPQGLHHLTEYFNLELVTVFVGSADYHKYKAYNRDEIELDAPKNLDDNIEQLIHIFAKMVNLENFIWTTPGENWYTMRRIRGGLGHISNYGTQFTALQEAFNGLTKLRRIELRLFLFHPSFFLVPPVAVKEYVIAAEDLTVEWWREFTTCPMVGVDVLHFGYDSRPYLIRRSDITLEDVAVTGLKEFSCDDRKCGPLPRDLEECILRRNPGLGSKDVKTLRRQRADMIAGQCVEELKPRVHVCASIVGESIPVSFIEYSDTMVSETVSQDFMRMFFAPGASTDELDREHKGWRDLKSSAKRRMMRLVDLSVDTLQDEYSAKGVDYENVDLEDFTKEALRRVTGSLEGDVARADEWVRKKRNVKRLVGACRNEMGGRVRNVSDLVERLEEMIIDGEELDKEVAMKEWAPMLTKGFEEGISSRK